MPPPEARLLLPARIESHPPVRIRDERTFITIEKRTLACAAVLAGCVLFIAQKHALANPLLTLRFPSPSGYLRGERFAHDVVRMLHGGVVGSALSQGHGAQYCLSDTKAEVISTWK